MMRIALSCTHPSGISSILVTAPGFARATHCCRKRHSQSSLTRPCPSQESGPRYKGTENKCKYLFEWESPAACAIENKVGDHCSVRDPKSDTVFNLYPLRKVYRVNATGRHFLLKICGALTKGTCTADSADAGACEVAGSKKIVLGKSNQKLAFESEILVLTYRLVGKLHALSFPGFQRFLALGELGPK